MKSITVLVFALVSLVAPCQTIKVGNGPGQMAFSANGRFLAIWCQNANYVYDVIYRRTYRCPAGELCDISPDGSKIAIVHGSTHVLTIWGVARHRILRRWEGGQWPDGATFSPDGNDVMFTPLPGVDKAIMPMVRMKIASGHTTEYGKWCRPLAAPIASILAAEGISPKTAPELVAYYSVGDMAMRWNPDGTIEDAVRFTLSSSMAHALFTMRLGDQKPYNVLTGFGLFYLWNGDYLRLDGDDKVSIIRWHMGQEHTLATVSDLNDGTNEEGDPGICPSRNTPQVLVYGIRTIADPEHPTKRQLHMQRLEVMLLDAQTENLRSLLNTPYPWSGAFCALSPDAKLFAYRSPNSANTVVLRRVR